MTFGNRLTEAIAERGSACIGIDPHAGLLHEWGLADDLVSLERFALTCVEAFGPVAAVVKPQSAFFERFGSRGIAILERTIAEARSAGALVLLDVKRGDIGSTMAAYADAYLDPESDLAVDAITTNPYLGVGALEPAFELAAKHGKGVFVIGLTSNKEAPQVQHARLPDGRTVAQSVIDDLALRNAGVDPLGSFGVVVGATIGDSVAELAGLNGPYLVPGIGAQGGTTSDVRRIFAGQLAAVLPSVSREVLRAGPQVAALRAAAERVIVDYAFLTS
ncbi:MAG: orotidine-5'-phosphate decarboxylase [Actinomycetota bacterium]|nr:orotidine-5'-phosphate decarboxylase [Actinomycetota bacterium]MDQ2957275.1 orotidine-5'-phosphate decarboxylase [Actinomycetota bacterium]